MRGMLLRCPEAQARAACCLRGERYEPPRASRSGFVSRACTARAEWEFTHV